MTTTRFPAATLTVDLGAIVANWRLLGAQAGAGTACAAVVKADAYGLGVVPVATALHRAGCRDFFVALVDEGLALRPHLPADARLFVLHGALPGAEAECAEHALIPVLNSPDQAERWSALGRARGTALPAALQVDTGMARLGFAPREFERLDAAALAGVAPVLLMSHLVSAEDPDDPLNELQRQRFEAARRRWPALACSLANSSGVFLGRAWHHQLLRPGAALYGVAPTLPAAGRPNPMRPVVRLQGRLVQWREIAPGDGVGYNHTWHAAQPTRVATVSVGYADGYRRSLSNRARLRFNGTELPLIGRVSMDTVTVDASAVSADALVPGAAFDLIDDVHDVNALAAEAGTNAYEILTSLGPRYERRYVGP